MKIIELRAENVKRLRAVRIKPDGSLVVIGGKNGAGKSSVLDAITYALGGARGICEKPIRQGAKRAEVVCDLGDLRITRTFTEKGGALKVEDQEGKRYPSPQAMLDQLLGRLSFDPLHFARQKPDEQVALLRDLVGIDFSEMDAERERLYRERTEKNRAVRDLGARLAPVPFDEDVPEAEIPVSDVLAELEQARQHNAQADRLTAEAEAAGKDVARTKAEIERLLAALEEEKAKLSAQEALLKSARQRAAEAARIEEGPILKRLEGLEETNRRIRETLEVRRIQSLLSNARSESEELSRRISEIDTRKREAIREAKFPVEGLGFDESGVTFNGLPFSQASSAEQLRVSVAMGLALNPTLRVLLIRDGSLLDQANLRLIAEMAAEKDAQVWIERVGDADQSAVIIEDGHVRENTDDE